MSKVNDLQEDASKPAKDWREQWRELAIAEAESLRCEKVYRKHGLTDTEIENRISKLRALYGEVILRAFRGGP